MPSKATNVQKRTSAKTNAKVSTNSKTKAALSESKDYISDAVFEFAKTCNLSSVKKKETFAQFTEDFIPSLGDYAGLVESYEDFSDMTLFAQLDYIKEKYKTDTNIKTTMVDYIILFYRWLIQQYPDYDFFADSTMITKGIVLSQEFRDAVLEDYFFMVLAPGGSSNDLSEHEKICFLMKNMCGMSMSYNEDTCFYIDTTVLLCESYRLLAIKYFIWCATTHAITSNFLSPIFEIMNNIYKAKQHENYPNPDPLIISKEEGNFIRFQITSKEFSSAVTANAWLRRMDDFLQFCNRYEHLTVDESVFDNLKRTSTKSHAAKKIVPHDDIANIDRWLGDHMKEPKYRQTRILARLLLMTELQVSQLCNLTINDISCRLMKDGTESYYVVMPSTNTHIKNKEYIITSNVYMMLQEEILDTDELRNQFPSSLESKYVFIGVNEKNKEKLVVFNGEKFNNCMNQACKDLKIELYTATDFKNTFKAYTYKFVKNNNLNELNLHTLQHSDSPDLIERNRKDDEEYEMMKIMNSLTITGEPENESTNTCENETENAHCHCECLSAKCGKCSNFMDDLLLQVNCLICPHFRTTIAHEPYFRKMREKLEQILVFTPEGENKELLETIRELYRKYELAIQKKKEEKAGVQE